MKIFTLLALLSLVIITAAFGAADFRGTEVEPYQAAGAPRTGKTFISVYLEPDCKGRATRIEVPCNLASDAALKTVGIKNDSIRSMKIPAGVSVTVYDAAGFKGDSLNLSEGKHESLGKLDQRISSMKTEFVKPQ